MAIHRIEIQSFNITFIKSLQLFIARFSIVLFLVCDVMYFLSHRH